MIKKITLHIRLLVSILVFFLLTNVSFSQNANLVISGNGLPITNGDITPSLLDFTDFGNVNIGATKDAAFVLKNMGAAGNNASRRITFANPSVVISGVNAAQFSVVSGPNPGNTLNGLGTVFSPDLVIRFTPIAPVGFKNATITVRYTNNGGTLTYVFAIRGNAVSLPEIDVQGNAKSIVDGDITPSIIDFTDYGTSSVGLGITKTYFVFNMGSANLNIGAISFSGANGADFAVTTLPTAVVLPGGNTFFVVTFTPLTIGTKMATISIVNNDSNKNPYRFDLLGGCIQTFFDSDGDGIFDNVDIDDDNDGIRDVIEEINCNLANGPKVNYKFLNESFGSGPRTTINTTYNAITTYCYENGVGAPNTVACPTLSSVDLNDGEYTVGSTCQIASWAAAYWFMGGDHTGDPNGRMAIFNASYTPGIFYTASIIGALPNIPITYSFWVLNLDRTDAPGIATRLRPNVRVEFRDTSNTLLAAINTGSIAPTTAGDLTGNWVQFTASLNLNVDAFNVIFINNETGGLGNDLALDDILITQALCDLDRDGVADVFDLDSDNDGIEDIIEVGLGSLSNGKGKMDAAWVDANANGLHDAAEGLLVAPDFDGDGMPNYMDLDSDNDTIFDVDESGAGNSNAVPGFVNGDGDITGDGKGDGIDSETFRSKDTNGDGIVEGYGDGILDLYDYGFNSYGNLNQGTNIAPFLNYVLDTDGDGFPNYLDVTSNGVTFDIANTLYAALDANNDGIIDGNTDIDKDGIIDTFDTNTAYFGSPRDLNRKLLLEFDGRNDYAQSSAILGGLSSATLMSWINLSNGYNADGFIVGQNNFQLKVSNIKKLQATVNGTTVTFNTALNTNQWYHVAAIYSGGSLRLYLNGLQVASQALAGNIAADVSVLTLGKNPIANNNYFRGKIDEVRVFNIGLTNTQLQRMVYQEVKDNATQVRGEVIPKDVGTLPFANLVRYYRMDVYKDDIIDDLSTPAIDLVGTKIFNHKIISVQQAPMPFLTERTGDFATAVNSPTKEIRGMDSMDYDWSIINVNHNITEPSNSIDLGLIINPGATIYMTNDTKLQNDWYLLIDGVIDLVGRSQLLQTTQSDLEPTSDGWIERDQQGSTNLYNYNYWSSPVGPINGTVNNNNYTVATVLRDGTNPANPTAINWIGGYNGAPTSPISVAGYWIYKFQNVSAVYANWTQVLQTGTLSPSQGYTMKGSGAVSAKQNYTFVGKPFNGDITNPISANNLNLSGNPYASAMDADKFIDDNVASIAGQATITGTIYYWEHSALNNTHILQDYQGGYAAYTKVGGTPPVAPVGINGLGGNTKIAQRFIPVGQGFFVYGSAAGGNIMFNNSQRLFVKENDPAAFEMFKNANLTNTVHAAANSNANDYYRVETVAKIRLGFNSANNYHRQILLGFMNEKASDNFDPGYDGELIDDQPNDMYFKSQEKKLIIQGVGFFNINTRYPLSIKTNQSGIVKIELDDIENFDANQRVFIFDKKSGTYHNIKNQDFSILLRPGIYDDRFYLTFYNRNTNVAANQNKIDSDVNTIETIAVKYVTTNQVVHITNNDAKLTVNQVYLYNLVGQLVKNWDVSNENQSSIEIPMEAISTGVYIVKIETTNGILSEKISIK